MMRCLRIETERACRQHAANAIRRKRQLLLEQNDEWLVGRRYLSVESLARLCETGEAEPDERYPVVATTARKEIALAPA